MLCRKSFAVVLRAVLAHFIPAVEIRADFLLHIEVKRVNKHSRSDVAARHHAERYRVRGTAQHCLLLSEFIHADVFMKDLDAVFGLEISEVVCIRKLA